MDITFEQEQITVDIGEETESGWKIIPIASNVVSLCCATTADKTFYITLYVNRASAAIGFLCLVLLALIH